jgi:hypothetical protein
LAALVVVDDEWEPFRFVDGGGAVVVPVVEYLCDLQAAGRSPATARSYGMDLLRWFRFVGGRCRVGQVGPGRGPGLLPVAAGRRPSGPQALAPS